MKIKKFENCYKDDVERIFFLTAIKQSFDSKEERENYFLKWCGDYLNGQRIAFVSIINDRVTGYIIGDYRTHYDHQNLKNELIDYPSHLHINIDPDFQGKGLGSALIKEFCFSLKNKETKGVHILTAPDAKNRDFYLKQGFSHEKNFTQDGFDFLFMGKKLD